MEQRLLKIILFQLKLAAALLLVCLAGYLFISSGSGRLAENLRNSFANRAHENEYITTASLKDEIAYTQAVAHVITVVGTSTQSESRLSN